MTRLFIDKREISHLPADLNSLETVLSLVESDHLTPDMVIRQIRVDGVPVIQNDRNASLQQDICGRGEIEIFTSTLREVAVDSIREAVTYLARAESAIPSLSSSLRTQSEPEASANLRQFCEGIYFTDLLLQKLEQSFQIRFADLKIRSGNAQECCIKLAALLKRIMAAHESRDFGLLADLLEREIGPLIPAFKETFNAIQSRILMSSD